MCNVAKAASSIVSISIRCRDSSRYKSDKNLRQTPRCKPYSFHEKTKHNFYIFTLKKKIRYIYLYDRIICTFFILEFFSERFVRFVFWKILPYKKKRIYNSVIYNIYNLIYIFLRGVFGIDAKLLSDLFPRLSPHWTGSSVPRIYKL